MNILALDLANVTGYALGAGKFEESGVWNFTPKRGESTGMRNIRLRAKLKEIHESFPLDMVSMELPAGKFKASLISMAKLHSVVETFCEDNKIEYSPYSPSELKKHATGIGNCGKPAMVAAAKKRWPGIEILDDNHADALWLLDLTKKDIGV